MTACGSAPSVTPCGDTLSPPPTRRWPPAPAITCAPLQTRAQAQGKPLKKPGAYNTDAYYQVRGCVDAWVRGWVSVGRQGAAHAWVSHGARVREEPD